jgi:hypothetical protein
VLLIIPCLTPRTIPVSPELIQKKVIWGIEKYSHNYGTTMSNEYLPVTVKRMPDYPPEDLIVSLEGPVDYRPLQYTSVERVLEINAVQAQSITIPVFFFPGWQLLLDNRPVGYTLSDEGTFQLQIPAGIHRLSLRFHNTPIRTMAEVISLVSFVFLIAYIIMVRVFSFKRYFKLR